MNKNYFKKQADITSKLLNQYSLPLAATVGTLTAFYKTYKYMYPSRSSEAHEIPIPAPCYPYVGHLLTMGENAGKTVSEWHKQYGPIIKLKLGIQDWLFIGDPLMAHNILKRNECSGRPHLGYVMRKAESQGVGFAQPNGAWNKARAAMLDVFSPKSLDKFMDKIQDEAENMLDLIFEEMDKNHQVDPYAYFRLYVANVICSICTGRKAKDIDDPLVKELFYFNTIAEKALAIEANIADFLPIISPFFEMGKAQKEFDSIYMNQAIPTYKKMVQERNESDPPNLVQVLESDRFGFALEDVAGILTDTLAGALNTPAATFSWMFAILCHRPEVQDKAHDELSRFFEKNNRLPTIHDRKDVPYCWSVIKESFRFISIGSFGMPHRVTEDFQAYGYSIPKDTIIVSTYDHIHHSGVHYTDGDTFNPERFLHDDKTMSASANGKPDKRDHFRYGWGRRICPGIYVSEVETFCAFVSVLFRCKIEPGTDEHGNPVLPDIEEGVYQGLTNLPKPYSVKFVRR